MTKSNVNFPTHELVDEHIQEGTILRCGDGRNFILVRNEAGSHFEIINLDTFRIVGFVPDFAATLSEIGKAVGSFVTVVLTRRRYEMDIRYTFGRKDD